MRYIGFMNGVHFRNLDLNLVVALDALLVTRSVTQAAARVGITQSAMSHALQRLRRVTGDELLVRASNGMVATARAEALGPPVRQALEEIERALSPNLPFDPETAQRTFTVATTDYTQLVLLPKLTAQLSREAPGIDLRIRAHPAQLAAPQLAAGTYDLAIVPVPKGTLAAGLYTKKLFDERFVCVVRNGHPLCGKKLTLTRYAAATHALIAPGGSEGGFVDDALADLGLRRRVAVAVPHFLVAPHLVAASDLILTLAARVARAFAEPLGLSILEVPPELHLAGFSMSAVWHERTQNDPAQQYLRNLLSGIAKGS